MKISCEIIRDILPLYAEDMVSQATRELVEDHLKECYDCERELSELNKAKKIPVQGDASALNRVKASIRRGKVLSVGAAVMTLISLAVTGWVCWRMPVTLPLEDGSGANVGMPILFGALILCGLFFLVSGRTSGTWREILYRLAILCGCAAISMVLVTGGQLSILNDSMTQAIGLETILLSVTMLLWHQILRLKRQGRSI